MRNTSNSARLNDLQLVILNAAAAYFAKTGELRKAAKALFDAIADGTVKVTINQRFKLVDAQDAHRAFEARETTRSTILVP